MSTELFLIFIQVSVIAYALVAGVFLAFSDFVMASLAAARPLGGIQSMQVINRKVFRTIFMALLLGMSAASCLLVTYALFGDAGDGRAWVVAGGTVYFVGTFVVTLVFNVPMNKRLDRMDFESTEAATYWRHYVPAWSFWNSVRAIASAVASVCLLIATVALAGS